MNNKIYIHFGLHKTGTTFLQKEVFPLLSDLAFIHKDIHSDFFSAGKNKFLISNEGIFGVPFDKEGWLEKQKKGITKLGELFPKAHLIVCFRNHEDLLLSLYKQYLHQGGTKKLGTDFFDIKEDKGILKIEDLYFKERIDLIEKNFRNKPFVFLYEELNNNFPKLLADLCNYLEIKKPNIEKIFFKKYNEGVKYYQANILRELNCVSGKIKKIMRPGLLNNGVFKLSRFISRRLCQRSLKFLSNRPIKLDKNYKEFLKNHYGKDWNFTKEYINFSRKNNVL